MSNDPADKPYATPDDSAQADAWSGLALALDPIEPLPTLRASLVAELSGTARLAPFAVDVARVFGVTREAARTALSRIGEPDIWRDGFAPGSRVFASEELRAANAVIARLPAGSTIPVHAHSGRELTLVLQGRLIEDAHTHYGPGDVLDMSAETQHAIAVSDDAECLVVFSPYA